MYEILRGKTIGLGICGGIAAYKSVELLRILVKHGAKVRVIATRNALNFIGKHTLQALAGNPLLTDLFEDGADASIKHIEWAQQSDAVIIAPATANCLSKLAQGMADDALSTFLLAAECPVIAAPSMNSVMYDSPPVRRNIKQILHDGRFIIFPSAGLLACGTEGTGRMPEPLHIADYLISVLTPKTMKGRRIMVTAGPTREHIDPVRFISNPSSGKMGFAIARAAAHRGAEVILITGPVSLPFPPEKNINTIPIISAADMKEAVFEHFDQVDILIKSAAVGDYRPKSPKKHKIKKTEDDLTLLLAKNPDILKEAGERKKHQFLVGFAAETESLEQNAVSKMQQKNLDMIVGNLIGSPETGFSADTNQVTLFLRNGTQEKLPVMSKYKLAGLLLDHILQRFSVHE